MSFVQRILFEAFPIKRRPKLITSFNQSESLCDHVTFMRSWNSGKSGQLFDEVLAADLFRASAYHVAKIIIRTKTVSDKLSGIFVKRRNTHRIVNYSELFSELPSLSGISFASAELEKLSPVDQVRLFSQADIVVGAHATSLVNVIYLLPRSYVVELFPPFWSYGTYQKLCENMDLSYKSVFMSTPNDEDCKMNPESSMCRIRYNRNSNFTVDVFQVMNVLWNIPDIVWLQKYNIKVYNCLLTK